MPRAGLGARLKLRSHPVLKTHNSTSYCILTFGARLSRVSGFVEDRSAGTWAALFTNRRLTMQKNPVTASSKCFLTGVADPFNSTFGPQGYLSILAVGTLVLGAYPTVVRASGWSVTACEVRSQEAYRKQNEILPRDESRAEALRNLEDSTISAS